MEGAIEGSMEYLMEGSDRKGTCKGMCQDVYGDVCRHVCRHVQRHVFRRVYGDMCSGVCIYACVCVYSHVHRRACRHVTKPCVQVLRTYLCTCMRTDTSAMPIYGRMSTHTSVCTSMHMSILVSIHVSKQAFFCMFKGIYNLQSEFRRGAQSLHVAKKKIAALCSAVLGPFRRYAVWQSETMLYGLTFAVHHQALFFILFFCGSPSGF